MPTAVSVTQLTEMVLERLRHERDGFLRTLRMSLPPRVWAIVALTCLVGFGLLLAFTPKGLPNGDAALYAQLIEARELGRLTIHIGYYALGIALLEVSPFDPDFTLNLVSTLLAALSAGLAGSISYTLTGRWIAAATAPAALLTLGVFLDNATVAEVYVPQVFFFLLCVQLVLWAHPIGAGVAFAAAFLITPSTALALPFLILLRPQKHFLAVWLSVAAGLVAIAIMPNLQDFLRGERGLLSGAAASQLSPGQRIAKEWAEILGFSAVLAFIVGGVATVMLSRRHRIFVAALALLWGCQLLFGERFADVPVQLPLYAMLAVMSGVGAARAARLMPGTLGETTVLVLFAVAALAAGAVSYPRLAYRAERIDDFRTSVLRLEQQAEPGYLAIGSWSTGTLLDHYLFRDMRQEVWVNTEALRGALGEEERVAAGLALQDALDKSRQVWLLEPPGQGVLQLFESYGYRIEPVGIIFVAQPPGR